MHKLIGMIHRMVDILRYDNTYAFELLKAVTLNKQAVFELDDCKLLLKSRKNKLKDFILTVKDASPEDELNFRTDSVTLQMVVAGAISLDHAIVKNRILVKAPFHDLQNIYRLAIILLAEGPLNKHLRNLWKEFDDTWNPEERQKRTIMPLEQQVPVNGYLLQNIPDSVLLTKI